MDSDSRLRHAIPWAALFVFGVGVGSVLLGVRRFFLQGRFGWSDALHCALLVLPASALLLVADYVFHHARLVLVMLLFVTAVLVFAHPSFAVAFGCTLMAMIAGPAVRDWRGQ